MALAVGDPMRVSYEPNDESTARAVAGSALSWRIPLILGLTTWFLAGCAFWAALTLRLGRPSRFYGRQMDA